MPDRRRHHRYLLEMNCFLTYASSVGTIIDICMGGLFCMCLEENKFGKDFPEKGADIVCEKAKLFAQGLPIKVLNSIVVPGEFAMGVKVRKCRLQFNQLKYGQNTQLEEIILSHARHFISEPGSILPS